MSDARDELTVTVGQELPPLIKAFTAVDLMVYGAATWDWYRMHYDEVAAKTSDFRGVFVDGQQWGAIFARQAVDHLGPCSFVTKMSLKYKAMAFAGDTVSVKGTIAEIKQESRRTTIVITHEARRGDTVLASGRTDVLASRK
ncbi:MaoC family dehydratase [Bradyrhizobium mercantei]|uniref:MaoC family dehydratase n=1 Tax=Bradyrhizobium mercantei TaxID=1904807 RepID=UPI0009785EC6|nr:MaoC family dehydratase [Bradyrhizobium mercantei]